MTYLRRAAPTLLLMRAVSSLRAASLPPSSDALALARTIYDLPAPPQLVVYATGGGATLPAFLLTVPGASRTVLEVKVPYAEQSLVELLEGKAPSRFCSADVARRLAAAAYRRALALHRPPSPATPTFGLGCTAALRSEPMRRGTHRAFIAVHTSEGVHELSIVLAKGARSRELEDAVVSRAALVALAQACGVTVPQQEGGGDFWRLASDTPDSSRGKIKDEKLQHAFTAHAAGK